MNLTHVHERIYGYEPATSEFQTLLDFYEQFRIALAEAEKEVKKLKAENETLKKLMKDNIEEEKELKIEIRQLRDELAENDQNR